MKCPKCGGDMVPICDGAKLFKITGYMCIKCLYKFKLKKPIKDLWMWRRWGEREKGNLQ
jgi:hypothetical protein